MSDSDRMLLAYAPEVTFALLPTTPVLKELRFTGEGLKQNQTLTPSQQIRDDRQVHDVVRTDASVSGDISIELSYASYDDFLEAGLQSAAFTAEETKTASDISAAVSGGQMTLTTAGAVSFASLDLYQWVRVSGFSNAGNNGLFKIVVAPGATTLVLQGDVSAAITQSAGSAIAIKQGAQIVNGTTMRSFSFEKEFSDLTNKFARYTGCEIDTLGLTFTPEAIITGSFGFMGKIEASATATFGTGTNTPANTNEVMASVNSVRSVLYRGSTQFGAQDATAFNFSIANNLRSRKRIGSLGPISMGSGTVGVTGALSIYLTDAVLMDAYLSNSIVSLAVLIMDAANNAYVVDFPAARFSNGQRVAGGQNQDILADMSFTAFRSPTEGITVRIQRFAA